jgi:hypothetical protein
MRRRILQHTPSPQTVGIPTVSLTNVPERLVRNGQQPRLLAGATNISFVDQTRLAPRVQQFSVDCSAGWPATWR